MIPTSPEAVWANTYHTSKRKRLLDLGIGIPLRLATWPLEKAAASYLKNALDDGGDSLFIQKRSLFGISRFMLSKLRTMRHEGPTDKEIGFITNNPRIPTLGARILRLLKVDELPQLNSVISGEMSLVSIRPISDETFAQYQDAADPNLLALVQQRIEASNIKPGLTGPAQITHLADDVRGPSQLNEHLRADINYVDTACLRYDLQLIASTVGALTTKAVHKASHYISQHLINKKSSQAAP